MLFDGRYKISQIHELHDVYSYDCMGELYDFCEDPDERHNRYYDPQMAEVKLRMLERF